MFKKQSPPRGSSPSDIRQATERSTAELKKSIQSQKSSRQGQKSPQKPVHRPMFSNPITQTKIRNTSRSPPRAVGQSLPDFVYKVGKVPNKSPPRWKPLPAKQVASYGLSVPSRSPPRLKEPIPNKVPAEKPRVARSPFSPGSKIVKS